MKELHARELSRNQLILRFDVILQHNWPIEQSILHIRVFFGGKTKKPFFDLFIHWLIKQIKNTYLDHFLWSYENCSIAFWMLSFLLCRQVKDKSKKLWKAWWTPRIDLPLRKAACKLVSQLFIWWNQFFMHLQAKGFNSDNICSFHGFAALLCEVAWAVSGSLSTPRTCKNLLTRIF